MKFQVEITIKEWVGYSKPVDSFKGTPEDAVDFLRLKYLGSTGFERLGNVLLKELAKDE